MSAIAQISHQDQEVIAKFLAAAEEIILGKEEALRMMLTCVLAGGHLLIEDVPGVGKTTFVKTLHALTGLEFKRIQFTNDMLPADILGGQILDTSRNQFYFRKGPIFCELLLADEINRATPKTQSACLQAMEEGEVSIDGETHPLPKPFFVIATQNPNTSIGTFPLPEAQLDRFLMRIKIGFPPRAAEKELLTGISRAELIKNLLPTLTAASILRIQQKISTLHVSDAIIEYIQDIIAASRSESSGLSPRTAIDLVRASRAYAFISGCDFVQPQHVKKVVISVINHRLNNQFSGDQRDGWKMAENLIAKVKVK